MKLSIIIALYNAELYIQNCINSVLLTNLKKDEFEIIIVNDGSEDSSAMIVQRLIENNSNVHLVNKANGGQSSARNMGFKMAKGDYILCLDSDDYIDGSQLEGLVNTLYEYKCDLLAFDFVLVDEVTKSSRISRVYKEFEGTLSAPEFMKRFTISGAMCGYFYKRDIIIKNNLMLLDGVLQEDEEFILKFLSYSDRVKYISLGFYHYLQRANSTVNNNNVNHNIRLFNDLIKVINSLNIRLYSIEPNSGLYKGFRRKVEQLIISTYLRIMKIKLNKSDKSLMIKSLIDNQLFPYKFEFSSLKFMIFYKIFSIYAYFLKSYNGKD
ncbi:glycosyltransferase family 2 protein [Sphingobacterium multivorum]|uniref:glycosyltransferase family 2 protein n=1 Tax=Sphingobacterium multivorum TaxID=28454 RepID=UPI003DA545B6